MGEAQESDHALPVLLLHFEASAFLVAPILQQEGEGFAAEPGQVDLLQTQPQALEQGRPSNGFARPRRRSAAP